MQEFWNVFENNLIKVVDEIIVRNYSCQSNNALKMFYVNKVKNKTINEDIIVWYF